MQETNKYLLHTWQIKRTLSPAFKEFTVWLEIKDNRQADKRYYFIPYYFKMAIRRRRRRRGEGGGGGGGGGGRAGQDAEKLEPSGFASRNVKWRSCYKKHFVAN